MNHVKIEGANCKIGADQPEYQPLFARKEVTQHTHNTTGEVYLGESLTVAYELTPEELTALLNGGKLMLRQLGGWRPCALWVE
jgi:hypothetical protein